MGQVAGYTPADYLIQHASRERRYARVPASTWDAILSHLRDPADAARLADSAGSRLLYRYAIPLYRNAADADDEDSAVGLAELLAARGDWTELRAHADAGNRERRCWPCWPSTATWTGCVPGADAGTEGAACGWPWCWPQRGDLDGADATRADAGSTTPPPSLAVLLAQRGDLEGLRARADVGDE